MNLVDKIEEIKRKPEHIRLRYVYFFVAISMIGVLIIWFFSLSNRSNNTANVLPANDLTDITGQFNEQKNSLQSTINDVRGAAGQNTTIKTQDSIPQ